MLGYGWVIFRQTPEPKLAVRRAIVAMMPWLYLGFLLSYWPDITREDDLPYVPLVPLSLIPLVMLAGEVVKMSEGWRQRILTVGLPLVVLLECAWTYKEPNLGEDRLRTTTHSIEDVLTVTKPSDYVMDNKGEYVFRPRAYYWVLEAITKARIRDGLIVDNIPRRLMEKGVKVCYTHCAKQGSLAAQFIAANYMPFDQEALDIGVLGKVIGTGSGEMDFEVAIPQEYAVAAQDGLETGELDGKPYAGPVWLAAGKHTFNQTRAAGRVAIILSDVLTHGFRPQYEAAIRNIKDIATLPPERVKKGPELQ